MALRCTIVRCYVHAWPQPMKTRLAATPVVDVNKIPSPLCLCVFRPADLAWEREMGQVS